MAKRNTTPEERKEFIEKQRAAEASYHGPGRRLPMNEGFIDRKGNIIKPDREKYWAEKNDTYNSQYNEAIALNKKYDSLVSKYGKDSNEVYNFETNKLGMHKSSGLEGTLAIIGLAGGIFFLSNNFTGNVIGSLNQTSSNIIGAVLFFVGILGAFFYFRRR